jgi:CubicO group peptidase (beta-lactamase class C family)
MPFKNYLLVFLLMVSNPIVRGQSWQDTTHLIENIFKRYHADEPGCQLAISRNGKLVFSHAWGIADMEYNVPLATTSVIEAGSVSKQFTAAAILLLEQQGKLSLSDDVRKYVPELPGYGKAITLAHLLHHTSGIKDCWSLLAFSDWPRGTRIYSNDDILYLLSHQHTLNHPPGEEYLYSNSNYILLAIIVERVSKMSLPAFTRTHIFEPVGMKHTSWRNSLKKIVRNRAVAYGKDNEEYFTDMPNETVYGNGGLLTTAEDLLLWTNSYLSGKLGGPALLSRQLQTTPLNSGRPNHYAAGLRIDTIRGWQVIAHDGATAAYRANVEGYPDLGWSIAWLANTSAFDGGFEGIGELRNLLLPDKSRLGATQPTANVTTATRHAEPRRQPDLKKYVGDYYSDEVEASLSVSLEGEKLVIHRYRNATYTAVAVRKDEFKIENSNVTVSFSRQKSGRVFSLAFSNPRVRNVSFSKSSR